MDKKAVILFDGVCNLCNGFVNFIIRRDKKNRFRFASLQSDAAAALLSRYSVTKNLKTIIFIENGKVYSRSGAALHICRRLSGGWPLLYGFIIVPSFIRDAFYDLVAKYRYRWFGKRDQCMIPTPALRSKFLDYENWQENTGAGSQ